jgi:hypothetical protein
MQKIDTRLATSTKQPSPSGGEFSRLTAILRLMLAGLG